jgi:hypothetical protein
MADQLKEVPHMRKKLIALSVALLTIGGSLIFTSAANADFNGDIVGVAGGGSTEYLIIPASQPLVPVGYSITQTSAYDGSDFGNSQWAAVGPQKITQIINIFTVNYLCQPGADFDNFYHNICTDNNAFSMEDQVEIVYFPGVIINFAGRGEDVFSVSPPSTSGATHYLLAAAGQANVVFQDTPEHQRIVSPDTVLNNGTFWYGNSLSMGFAPISSIQQWDADVCNSDAQDSLKCADDGSLRLSWHARIIGFGGWRIGNLTFLNDSTTTVKEIWQSDTKPSYYPPGIQQNVNVSDIATGGWTLCYSANYGDVLPTRNDLRALCSGTYILLAGGYRTGQEPTPTLTLPPDFLTPKTYGNPSPVTGFAPVAPATPITPTAPIITASNSSVIYNGVPQSAAYSVDQKSSCSTTYNGSSIPPVSAGTYAVSITCSANSLTSTATSTLTITKATPVISWSTPSAITSTTKLGASQLNAFSYIPGTFT